MPRGDRTGPLGQGPMTGRAAGFCSGQTVAGFQNPAGGGWGMWGWAGGRGGGGRGRGGGWGGGRGRGRGYGYGVAAGAFPPVGAAGSYVPPPPLPAVAQQDEVALLQRQAEYFSEALENIKRRLDEVQSRPQTPPNPES